METYYTDWGDIEIAVTADWSQASCQIDGDPCGRQVADFGHDGWAALRAAVEHEANAECIDDPDLIEQSMRAAKCR